MLSRSLAVLASGVLAIGLSTSAAGESVFSLSPDSGTFEVGDVVDVTINISNDFEGVGEGARGFAYRFNWDPNVVRLVDGADGVTNHPDNPYTTEVATEFDEAEGTFLRAYAVFPIARLVYDGPAASLQFEFLEAAPSTTVTFTDSDTRFTGFEDGVTTDAQRLPATYTVEGDEEPEDPAIAVTVGGEPIASGGTVDFGIAEEGEPQISRSFSVSNPGTGDLEISSVSADAPYVVVAGGEGFVVTPGDDDFIQIALPTDTIGAFSGSLTFTTNVEGEESQTFNLTGEIVEATVECDFQIDPTSSTAPAEGTEGSITVTVSDESCEWTAVSNDDWITITSGAEGTGGGEVTFSVAENDGDAREGTIAIADVSHTVSQEAAEEDEDPADPTYVELIAHTSFFDAWATPTVGMETEYDAANRSTGTFETPERIGATGFVHNPFAGEKVLAGDFNGDGRTSLIMVTPGGELWQAYRDTDGMIESVEFNSDGWQVSALDGYDVFVGDFNGNGRSDVLQINSDGDLYIAFTPDTGVIPSPSFVQESPLASDRSAGLYILVGDFDGSGRDDLAMFSNDTQNVLVALATEDALFPQATTWGNFPFSIDLNGSSNIRVGDVTGDGRADLVYHAKDPNGDNPLSTTYVAVSLGDSFADAADWGRLGLHDDATRGSGWVTFIADVDGDGTGDLIQLNEFGEAWVAISNGEDGFAQPEFNAALGYTHRPDGPWQVFVAPVPMDEPTD